MKQQNPIVKWPWGAAKVILMAAFGELDVYVNNTLTILDGESVKATGDRTIHVEASDDLDIGSRLIVKTCSTGTEKLIPGVGVNGKEIEGEAGETIVVEYIYDGSNFYQVGLFNS